MEQEQEKLLIPALPVTAGTTRQAKWRKALEESEEEKRAVSKKKEERNELCKCGDEERRRGLLTARRTESRLKRWHPSEVYISYFKKRIYQIIC